MSNARDLNLSKKAPFNLYFLNWTFPVALTPGEYCPLLSLAVFASDSHSACDFRLSLCGTLFPYVSLMLLPPPAVLLTPDSSLSSLRLGLFLYSDLSPEFQMHND